MRYRNVWLAGIASLVAMEVSANGFPVDSVGMDRKGGQPVIVFKVTPGQTLYSLLKRYNVTMDEFKAVNPGFSGNLRSEEVVYSPRNGYKGPITPPAKSGQAANTHKVEPGQTLFSIARKYDIGTADLKKWNNLPSDGTVQAGQVLYLSDPGPRVAEAPKKPEPKPAEPIARNEPKKAEPKPEEPKKAEEPKKEEEHRKNDTTKAKADEAPKPVLPAKPESEPLPPANRTENEPVPNAGAGARKVVELGLCELIDAQDRTGKYLALHRTAPVGTMLTIRNEANNQSVVVKVIGKLPDTGMADRVIVRLSARAFERLMPTDRRIRAEVSYLAAEQ